MFWYAITMLNDPRWLVDRYLCSKFLGHTRADDLLDSIKEATQELELEKIINIGMDGPAVNHRLFRLLQDEILLQFLA